MQSQYLLLLMTRHSILPLWSENNTKLMYWPVLQWVPYRFSDNFLLAKCVNLFSNQFKAICPIDLLLTLLYFEHIYLLMSSSINVTAAHRLLENNNNLLDKWDKWIDVRQECIPCTTQSIIDSNNDLTDLITKYFQ